MSILTNIVTAKRAQIDREMLNTPWVQLEQDLQASPAVRGFLKAICSPVIEHRPALIAEIKKASPSKGLICDQFKPASHAISYQKGGATCLSILTDSHFQGCEKDFLQVRAASTLPLLRKDFMIDPWQILQSRAMGADCILLIMAILSEEQALELYDAAKTYKLDLLVEVHDHHELQRALNLPSDCMIGINNRNLHDFSTNLNVTKKLLQELPKDRIVISESGIQSQEDVKFVSQAGAKGILVGESLMRQNCLQTATRNLLG